MLEPYKPKGWDEVPAGLKDPDGAWTTIHSGTLGLFVNKDALGGKPVPACWKDLPKPDYKGMVGYLDPSSAAVGYVGAVAVNMALGGIGQTISTRARPLQGPAKNERDRAETDLLCARGLGRNPDPVRLRLQRLSRQIYREGQLRIRHPVRGNGGVSLRDRHGEERAAQGQGAEGLDFCCPTRARRSGPMPICALPVRSISARSRPSSCRTATMPAPRASTGRRWSRCRRALLTAISPKSADGQGARAGSGRAVYS